MLNAHKTEITFLFICFVTDRHLYLDTQLFDAHGTQFWILSVVVCLRLKKTKINTLHEVK